MTDFRTSLEFRTLMHDLRLVQQEYNKIYETLGKVGNGKSLEEVGKAVAKKLNAISKQMVAIPHLCETVSAKIGGEESNPLEGEPEDKKNYFVNLSVPVDVSEKKSEKTEKLAKKEKKTEEIVDDLDAPADKPSVPGNSMVWIYQRYEAGENLREFFTKAQEDAAKADAKKENADFDKQEKNAQRRLVAKKLWETAKADKALKAKVKAAYDAIKSA